MFVSKIKEIKNTDAFDSFSWNARDLKRYNLIYGWNGSGKTSMSRLFNFLEKNSIHIPQFSAIEFLVQTENGNIKHTDISSHSLNVRVFNKDFISENLLFEQSHAKKIVILGKENVAVQKEIEILSCDIEAIIKSGSALKEQLNRVPDLEKILSQAGGEVPKQFAGTPLASDKYYGRSYNKTKVEKRLENGDISESNLSSLVMEPSDLDAQKDIIKNEKNLIELEVADISDFSKIFINVNAILDTSISITEIEEFKEDKHLRDWVETGYKLHNDRKLKVCMFCKNNISDELFIQLGRFFTEELEKAKEQIINCISSLETARGGGVFIFETSGLFPDLSKEFETSKTELLSQATIINETVSFAIDQLKIKSENFHDNTQKYTPAEYPADAIKNANALLKKIREIVFVHNQRVGMRAEEIKKAAEAIELHIIAKTLTDRDYFKYKKENEKISKEIHKIEKEYLDLDGQIKTKKASLQNATDAIEKINAILKEFFGGEHLHLEIAETPTQEIEYVLKRRDKDARYLSEGETSVMALAYFLIKLEEDGCDKKNCLVVVDDPVDSQDGIFLFRTAGLLKRLLKDAGQLILLTHNFEFFNLMRDWCLSPQLRDHSELFLISNNKTGTPQEVKIENLPSLLKQYKSEYQYLFSRLYRYANNIEPLDEPLVANISRKLLEYFAGFKWACKTTEDFANIVNSRFIGDVNHLKKGTGDFVIKFLHEYSHGQDFSRPISASMLEGKQIAKNVLEFIRLADDEHFGYLKDLSDPKP